MSTRFSVAAMLSMSPRSRKRLGKLLSTSPGLGSTTGEISRSSQDGVMLRRSESTTAQDLLSNIAGGGAGTGNGLEGQVVWRSDSGKRWLIPLAVFLCLFGLLLILATTVEALAPFIYAIF